MAGCVTQVDLDAAQTVLDGLQTAISEARAAHETQLAAAEAAEAKEKERLWSEAHEVGEEEDEEGGKTKKRMVAMYALYNGHGFSGMQLNPNVRTIESELVKALIATHAAVDRPAGSTARAPAAPPEAGDCLRAVKWSRAARTDKGVSACGQVVSAWLWLEPNLAAKLNAVLPPQIRVLGFTRVKKNFNARHTCDSRRYEYYLPQWAFDPDLFPARPSWRPPACPADAAVFPPGTPVPDGEVARLVKSSSGQELMLREGYSLGAPPSGSRFEFDGDCAARLNAVLEQFQGVHNFHNFSPAVLPEQMSAQRYIYTCECEPITSGGEPWVRIRIHGQSFLLNQIRKMVGLALAVYRGHAPADAIHLATDPQRNFGTPMAPELGLLLAECCFDAYNRNTGPGHGEVSLEQYSDAVETFKQGHILPMMRRRDREEGVNYQFVEMLSSEERHFAVWHKTRPIRNVKRPRTLAEKAEKEERERKRAARKDELLASGIARPQIAEILFAEFPKVPFGEEAAAAAAAAAKLEPRPDAAAADGGAGAAAAAEAGGVGEAAGAAGGGGAAPGAEGAGAGSGGAGPAAGGAPEAAGTEGGGSGTGVGDAAPNDAEGGDGGKSA